MTPVEVHPQHHSERIAELEAELADVRHELDSAGQSYIRDVQAHEREIVRLKKLLTDHGISWNPGAHRA